MTLSLQELLLFAKYPEPGRVKTRLARTVGADQAARLYREMIETVIRKTKPLDGGYKRVLCFDPPEREDDFGKWFPLLEVRPQSRGDLGQRMSTAFQESFATGSNRVVLIGTDCVDVDRSLVSDAFDRLDHDKTDLVLGPAEDGGYYLIGMKRHHFPLFEKMPWSTASVFDETLQKASRLNLTIVLLKTLADLDV